MKEFLITELRANKNRTFLYYIKFDEKNKMKDDVTKCCSSSFIFLYINNFQDDWLYFWRKKWTLKTENDQFLMAVNQVMDCFIPGRDSYWDFLKVIGHSNFQKIIVIPIEHLQKLYWFWKFEGSSSKIRCATSIWILKRFLQEIHFLCT